MVKRKRLEKEEESKGEKTLRQVRETVAFTQNHVLPTYDKLENLYKMIHGRSYYDK